jgi:hypothetical protein
MAEQAPNRSDATPEVGARTLLPPPRQRSPLGWVLLALLILGLAAGGWWYQHSQAPAPVPERQALPAAPPTEPVAAAPAAATAASVPPLPEPKVAKARWTKPTSVRRWRRWWVSPRCVRC